MAFLAIINRTQGGATFYVSDLNIDALYDTISISVDGKRSPNLAEAYKSQTSKWWTVSSLNCGQNYTVFWYIKSKGGSEAEGQGSFTVLPCSVDNSVGTIPWASAYPDSQTGGLVTLAWGAATNATGYTIHLWRGSSSVNSYYSSSTTRDISGLVQGASYTAYIWGTRPGESDGPQNSVSFNMPTFRGPPGQPGAIILQPSTETEGTLNVSWGGAYDADNYLVTIYRSNGTYIDDVSTYYTYTTFRGLVVGWTYYVVVVPRNSAGNGTSRTSSSITMPVIKYRPNNWQWDSVKSSGSVVNVTASEWNRFLNRIDAFRLYKGLSSGSYTYASVGGSITANQYNQARAAISSMGATPYVATAGTQIYASQFNQIRDYLNAIT